MVLLHLSSVVSAALGSAPAVLNLTIVKATPSNHARMCMLRLLTKEDTPAGTQMANGIALNAEINLQTKTQQQSHMNAAHAAIGSVQAVLTATETET